jgi:hypothetical protein
MKRTALILLAVVSLVGCSRVDKDLTTDAAYASMIGRKYQTKIELVLYRSSTGKLWIEKIGGSMSIPPANQMPKKFPFNYYDTKLLGILPVESEFKTVKIVQENVNVTGFIQTVVEITKSSDPQWVGKIVHPSGLTETANGREAVFRSEYVEEVPQP